MWPPRSCLDLLEGEKIGKERGCNGGLCSELLGVNGRERERGITLEEWEDIRTRRRFDTAMDGSLSHAGEAGCYEGRAKMEVLGSGNTLAGETASPLPQSTCL